MVRRIMNIMIHHKCKECIIDGRIDGRSDVDSFDLDLVWLKTVTVQRLPMNINMTN